MTSIVRRLRARRPTHIPDHERRDVFHWTSSRRPVGLSLLDPSMKTARTRIPPTFRSSPLYPPRRCLASEHEPCHHHHASDQNHSPAPVHHPSPHLTLTTLSSFGFPTGVLNCVLFHPTTPVASSSPSVPSSASPSLQRAALFLHLQSGSQAMMRMSPTRRLRFVQERFSKIWVLSVPSVRHFCVSVVSVWARKTDAIRVDNLARIGDGWVESE